MTSESPDLSRLKIDRGEEPSFRSRKRRSFGLGRIILLLFVLGAAYVFRRPVLEAIDRVQLPVVRVVRVTRTSRLEASAVSGTAANGYVVARRRAALSADTPGRITKIDVEEGSVVKEGDIVAELFADEFEAALEQAQAELASNALSVERAKSQEAVARAQLAELESRGRAAEARVHEAEATLARAELEFTRATALLEQGVDTKERLDDARAEQQRSAAQLTAARATLEEAQSAIATGRTQVDVSVATVTEAASRLDVAEAARALAQATLDKTKVRAPFSGVIVLKDAEVGEVVSPNSQGGNSRGSVATLVDFTSLEVQVELPETSLSAVELGTPAQIFLDAFPEDQLSGTVERIWPTANRQKATVEIRVALTEIDPRMRPDMGARVVFAGAEPAEAQPVEAGGRILIPSDCVVRVDGRESVFVLDRDVVRLRPVEVGGETSGRTLIKSGLDNGERIVVQPPTTLADGDRVRIEE